ncbi:hypothetical protein BaRGS_00021503 [Batillaria attramentaria]|uniref:Uncharacterized protein n=1 Tax=Batillaria attramentaria TaxID=370345 RepID=A0ABD0KJA6_9CAEN
MHVSGQRVEMNCKVKEHEEHPLHGNNHHTSHVNDFQICERSQSLNDPSCNHTRLGLASQHDCYYCCQSEECFRNVFNLPKLTTTAASTTGASTPLTSATPTHCYADSGWACQSEEFCAMTIGYSSVVMICQDNSTWEGCVSEQDQNAESCSPTLTSTEGPDCHYCCKSARCFADLLLHTDHLVTTEAPSKDCIQTGQWACESHEFCALKFGNDTTIKCEDINFQWQSCMDSGVLCSPNKLSGAEFSECSYCCRDLDCIMGLLRPSASTTTPTPSSTYWTPATTGHQTVTEAPPDTKTCFHNGAWACQTDEPVYHGSLHSTKACDDNTRTGHDNIRTRHNNVGAIYNDWKGGNTRTNDECTDNSSNSDDKQAIGDVSAARTQQLLHFCRIRTYIATGELAMDCLPATGTELLACGQESSLKACHQPEDFNNHDCHFCCLHDYCVVDKSNILITMVTTSAAPSTPRSIPTSSQEPSTTPYISTTDGLVTSTAAVYYSTRTTETPLTAHLTSPQTTTPTSPLPRTSPPSGTCYNCTGLDCFLNPTILECPDHLCMTMVVDAEIREITRRCATKPECDAITSNAVCHDPDHARLVAYKESACEGSDRFEESWTEDNNGAGMSASVLFSLLLLLLTCMKVTEPRGCFHEEYGSHACDPEHLEYFACVSQHWYCHPNEFCHMTITTDHNVMECKDNHAYNVQACEEGFKRNEQSCDPRLTATHHGECHFCCHDAQCFKDLTSGQSPTFHPPQPAPNSCYTSECGHGRNLANCSSGQWACSSDEHCTRDQASNSDCCSPDLVKPPDHVHACHYCCENDQCVKDLLSATTPTPTHCLVPAPNSCYTSPCRHGHDNIVTCSSGQWACKQNEFCQIHTQNTGDITMTCTVSNTSTTSECTDKLLEYFCPTPGDYQQHDCHFCCPDDNCVSHVSDLQKPPSTSTTVTSHQESTHKVSQTSLQPSTQRVSVTTLTPPTTSQTSTTSSSQDSCVDSYAGDCNTDFAGRCSESDVLQICQKTCGTCDCHDMTNHGDCVTRYSGINSARHACHNHISSDVTTTINAKNVAHVTRAAYVKIHIRTSLNDTLGIDFPKAVSTAPAVYHGRVDFAGRCSESEVQKICQKTCGICDMKAASTTWSPTALALRVTCTVCHGLACLVDPPQQECPAGLTLCMTIVKDSATGRDIIRGCVDEPTCDDLHLNQTLQNAECNDVDHNILHHDNTCFFCCHGDNCNRPPQAVPDVSTLYLPVRAPGPRHCFKGHECDAKHFTFDHCVNPDHWECHDNEICTLGIDHYGVHMTCHHSSSVTQNSCYTSSCHQGDDIATCSSGQWACNPDELCQIHTKPPGDITMTCTARNTPTASECGDKHLEYPCRAPGDFQRHDCHFCCPDDNCVIDLSDLQKPSSTAAAVTSLQPSTQTVAATSHEQPTSESTSERPSTILPETTSQKPSTTLQGSDTGLTCTVCHGLACLMDPPQQECPAGMTLCMTTVKDSQHSRDIIRGCADQPTCDDLHLNQTLRNAECIGVDHNIVHHDNTCVFCCHGDNCNRPPQAVPDVSTLYRGDVQLLGEDARLK